MHAVRLTGVCCLIVGLVTPVRAQDEGLGTLFLQLDRDRDGIVGRAEGAASETVFQLMLTNYDKNGDSMLTREEVGLPPKAAGPASPDVPRPAQPDPAPAVPPAAAANPPAVAPPGNPPVRLTPTEEQIVRTQFRRLDADADGQISRLEGTAVLAPYFDEMGVEYLDLNRFRTLFGAAKNQSQQAAPPVEQPLVPPANRPPVIDPISPLQLNPPVIAPPPRVQLRPQSPPSVLEAAAGPRRGRAGLPPFMRLLDANANGKLSIQEFHAVARLYTDLDADKDGELDMQELLGMSFSAMQALNTENEAATGPRIPQALIDNLRAETVPSVGPIIPPNIGAGNNPPVAPANVDPAQPPMVSPPVETPAASPPPAEVADPEFARQKKSFDLMDTDRNGYLTSGERPEFILESTFNSFDTNADRRVSLEEYLQFFRRSQYRPPRDPAPAEPAPVETEEIILGP